jgi:hypothetical protein
MNPSMSAPAPTSNYSSKEKNPNLQLIPAGLHAAIIYGVVNVGTQIGEYQGKPSQKNTLKILIEFPTHRQLFWVDDTVPSPTALIMDFAYVMGKNKKTGVKTKLVKFVETIYNTQLQESQYLQFDFSQLPGTKIFANVLHYQKMNGEMGVKIDSVSAINPAMFNPDSITQTNPNYIYSVQMGFENLSFASLPYFYRGLIKDSVEGKAHRAQGGRFTKLDENGNMIIDDNNDDYTPAPLGKLVMINPQFTYEQLKGAGWTDQAMIDNGYARRDAVAPAPIPQPTAIPQPAPVQQSGFIQQPQQVAYQSPQSPMALTPQMPLAHSNPTQPMLTMIDKSAPYEAWIANGWTDQLLIEKGKAMMMPPANEVFPQTPQQPLAPQVPQAMAPQIAPAQQAMPNYQNVQVPQAMEQQPIAQGIPTPQPSAAALFQQAPAAPVVNMGQPIPQAPVSGFEQPMPMQEPPADDLPF